MDPPLKLPPNIRPQLPPPPPSQLSMPTEAHRIQTFMGPPPSPPQPRSMSGVDLSVDPSQVQQFFGPRPTSASGLLLQEPPEEINEVRQLPTPASPPSPPSQASMPTEVQPMPPPAPPSPTLPPALSPTSMGPPPSPPQPRSMSGVELSVDLSKVQPQEPPEEINEVSIDVEREEDEGGPVCETDALHEQVKQLQNELRLAQNTKNEHYATIEKSRVEMEAEHQRVVYLRNQVDELKQQLQQLETQYEDKGKMKTQSYKDPSLPLKNNQARELEDLSNFVLLGLTKCYGVVYFLYSAFLGKKGSNTRVMTGLHIWTVLLILLLILPVFIGSIIRIPFGTVKVMRFVMSGLLLVSSAFVFILLLLQLGLF